MARAVPILTYHRVAEPRRGRFERYTVTPGRFRRQLALLDWLGFTAISLDDVAAFAVGAPGVTLPRRPYAITFDDGYRDLLEHAVPALERAGARATLFAVSEAALDGWVDWGGLPSLELLRADELKDLAGRGFAIGCHSATHPHLPGLDGAALEREVAGARAALAERTGSRIAHFCYPYGEVDGSAREAVRRAGFTTACTTARGKTSAGADPYALPRLTVGKRMGLLRFTRRVLLG